MSKKLVDVKFYVTLNNCYSLNFEREDLFTFKILTFIVRASGTPKKNNLEKLSWFLRLAVICR